MFTNTQRLRFTDHLNEIRDDLLLNKMETADEVWWPTPYYINPDEYAFQESYDIFNGNCGIALFLLELYRFERNEEHLVLIDKLMCRMINSDAILKPKFFAFYTGIGGVIYTNLKIYETTRIQKYLDYAVRLILANKNQLSKELLKADLLSGYTGNLLVFTLLYHHSQNDEVLQLIHLLLDRLVQEARVSAIGLKWDYSQSKKAFDSMAGFSHGASGIAYSLMQLHVYFDSPGLLYLAEEALAYEMQYYNDQAKNWLDLRMGNVNLAKPDAHLWQLETFASSMVAVNAWAHGAAGVGLARNLAFKLTQKERYLTQCNNALERCERDLKHRKRPDFTLVSGYTGMIPFLLCNMTKTGIRDEIYEIINGAIEQYQKTNSYSKYLSCGAHDYGLFSGKTGVGYLLLQLLRENEIDSVTNPVLPEPIKKVSLDERFSVTNIKWKLFSRYYGTTVKKLKLNSVDIDTLYKADDIDQFGDLLSNSIVQLSGNHEAMLQSFQLESEILKLWKLHKGYFSYQQRSTYLKKQADEFIKMADPDLLGLSLRINDHVKYYQDDENRGGIILLCDANGVEEIKIGIFPAIIMKALSNGKMMIAKLISEINQQYFNATVDKHEIGQRIILQIRLLLKGDFVSCIA